ncbi:WD40 repeat domain-containing protein [Streptomyces sp. NPDC002619]|uniref:WD40 repeat domain-containing protein n=1 Tax=Streptomyces sp. NPDC002619 TaxID=3364655 RepID=UPI0036CA2DBA
MNVEELVRDCLREQAAQQRPLGPGFADRVLAARRRRRTRRLACVAAATAAVVAVAVAVPSLSSGRHDSLPAGVLHGTGTTAHPDQSPPRELIAAGNVALAAYYTEGLVKLSADAGATARTYWLLDPRTGRYEKDSRWGFVAVAPGMRTAAVLERSMPARRIGLLDLATGKVERWIQLAHGVGGLTFSRDGSRLVATTYAEHPDLRRKETVHDAKGRPHDEWLAWPGASSRSGFSVVDVATGHEGPWSKVSPGRDTVGRADFSFTRDGALVYARIIGGRDGMQRFYDLAGKGVAAPAKERYLRSDVGARLSPSGTLAAVGLTAEAKDKSWSKIVDPATGKEIARVRGAELLAWADGRRLVAWERTPGAAEYRPRLVLVSIGSDKVVQLSGTREQDGPPGRKNVWQPVFAER